MKAWGMMLARVAVVIGLYFAWFFTATTLFFDYVYPKSTWFEQNTVTVIILNDMVGLPLMLLAWRFIFKENLFKAAQFRVMGGKSVAIALWIGLGAGLFTVAFSRLPAIASDKYRFHELFDYLNRAEWYVFLVFLLLGNIYKETLFRGILMNEFRRVLPVWVAIVIQGVLYGALFFWETFRCRCTAFSARLFLHSCMSGLNPSGRRLPRKSPVRAANTCFGITGRRRRTSPSCPS